MRHLSALVLALLFSSAAHAYVLGTTTPGKWGNPTMGTGATITWSLTDTGVSCQQEYAGCTFTALADFMPSGFEAELGRAFDAWSAVADLTFIQVADSGGAFNSALDSSGDIRIAGHPISSGGAPISGPFIGSHDVLLSGASDVLAHGFFPPNNGVTAAGDIHFDTGNTWSTGSGVPGFDIFQVFAHELGHALGLDHTSVPNSLMNPTYSTAFSGPQADDIAGMQFIYGLPLASPLPAPQTWLLLMLGLLGFALSNTKKQLPV